VGDPDEEAGTPDFLNSPEGRGGELVMFAVSSG